MGVNFNFQYYAFELESLNLIYKREYTIEEKKLKLLERTSHFWRSNVVVSLAGTKIILS
jgi:hypothetical protein